ncbi:Mitochondrial chaperone BCS1 [Gracilariopsis chorda]|uniref:Mitochondrial chaperone BCS1 n=1 Tax=Gracilariopsis chorda TaxID=448386 RepID=A0A2V3IV90_9FLOR|nr:Mitochondrial chaperone BCS1 [Gracilariopsis chorda]|eukprot:PXF46003.1 Mitochondrial chaperone BCS1 [Gracilariopsis chorda]
MKHQTLSFPDPARKPVLAASNGHISPEHLRIIADHFDVSEDKLATLVVPSEVSRLYLALTEYAGYHPTPSNFKHKSRLWISYADPYQYRDEGDEDDDDDDDDSDEEDSEKDRKKSDGCSTDTSADAESEPDEDISSLSLKALSEHIDGVLQKRTKKKRPSMPKYRMDLGSSLVVWPPPPHILPEALHKKEKGEKRVKGKLARAAEEAAQKSSQTVSESSKQETKLSKEYKGEQITLHLYHYEIKIGLDFSGRGRPNREVHIATPHGEDAIKRFMSGIIHWYEDKKNNRRDGKRFAVYRLKVESCGDCSWDYEGMKRSRPVDSVILGNNQMETIVRDTHKFLRPTTKKWYVRHGLPYRRSYLFYGSPGTGKTSTIRVLAGLFRLDCCFLTLTSHNFSNQTMLDAMKSIPSNGILVLEDVDALFNEDRKSETPASLTFSGLLNALDGITSAEGIITILSSNHIEKLDPALIRGGRVDKRFHFEKPNAEHIEQIFKNFYPDTSEDITKRFSQSVLSRKEGDEARSMATLQQLFIHFRGETAETCIDGVDDFFETHFPTGAHRKKPAMYM